METVKACLKKKHRVTILMYIIVHLLHVFTSSDFDECGVGLCGDNGDCINTPGSFVCICHEGYSLGSDDICTGELVLEPLAPGTPCPWNTFNGKQMFMHLSI